MCAWAVISFSDIVVMVFECSADVKWSEVLYNALDDDDVVVEMHVLPHRLHDE